MQKPRRLSLETIVTACALAAVVLVGGWAASGWNAASPDPSMTAMAAPQPGEGAAPVSDTRAGMYDVCSRRVGCLIH